MVILRPVLLKDSIRILEYIILESTEVYSRKNKLGGYGISPSELDKKTPIRKFYAEIYAKRHPSKKGKKKLEWDKILEKLRDKQKRNTKPAEISVDKTTPEILEKWFSKYQKKFKKRPQISSRFFRLHKNQLLKERLIVKLEHPSKKIKYFSLSPLGICFLVKNRSVILQGELLEKTLRILNSFYVQPGPKMFGSKKKFNFQDSIKTMIIIGVDHNMTDFINEFLYHQIEYSKSVFDESYSINIRYPISFNLENIIARFILSENEIRYYENLVQNEYLFPTDYLSEIEFHTCLATLLLYGIFYYAMKSYFAEFMKMGKNTRVDVFKYADYDYMLDNIKKQDKNLLEITILLNQYYSRMLSNTDEISKELKFFQKNVKQFVRGEDKNKKIYKHDQNSVLSGLPDHIPDA